METNFSNVVLDNAIQIQELKDEVERVAGERDGLRAEFDLQNEQVEQLFLDLQELEKTSQEDQVELRKASAERALLLEEKERWEDRMHKVAEDNRMIILALVEQMDRKEAVMEAFEKKVLEMVRRTRAIVEHVHVPAAGGFEGEASGEKDTEIDNVVQVMAVPVELELQAIEAAVASAAG